MRATIYEGFDPSVLLVLITQDAILTVNGSYKRTYIYSSYIFEYKQPNGGVIR